MAAANGTRRNLLGGLVAAAAVAAVSAALAPLVAASRRPPPAPDAAGGPGGALGRPGAGPGEEPRGAFDEMYRGHRIRGVRDTADGVRAAGEAGPPAPPGEWRVTVDERPLHLMRRADGGYLTMIDHYQSYPTPLAAARAAVDELGGTQRLRATAGEAERGEGHGHGVHA
ncbi:tyrosinase family oxidase copper chaperone [Streptomyces fructofermentans]|uniref:tyrosinase family oxidase copper chaperone n=1 Tax=Streptomyces fructofermentans TaxID=152141 RepID=UPI00340A097A